MEGVRCGRVGVDSGSVAWGPMWLWRCVADAQLIASGEWQMRAQLITVISKYAVDDEVRICPREI
jgi:hypothetical protein